MNGSYVGKARGGKLLRMDLGWTDETVISISIRGDFFAHPEEGFEAAETAIVGNGLAQAGSVFGRELEARGVTLFGLLPGDIDDAVAAILARAGGDKV